MSLLRSEARKVRYTRSYRYLALGAVEQLDSQLFLELPDLVAERGLAEVQLLRGAAEMQLSGRRLEDPQLPQRQMAHRDSGLILTEILLL